MSMLPEYARPEPGFDPNDNQVVLDFYSGKNSRIPMDPKGQRGPTVQERIDEYLESFEKLTGRKPSEEEKKRVEEVSFKCSGWLEGLKIDLEGETHVPIHFFNRLVAEQEESILWAAREHIISNAKYITVCQERDERITHFREQLENANREHREAENKIAEIESSNDKLTTAVEESKVETQKLQFEIEQLKRKLPPSIDDQFKSIEAERSVIDDLKFKNAELQMALDKSKSDAKDYASAMEEINGYRFQVEDLRKENVILVDKAKRTYSLEREVKQLCEKIARLKGSQNDGDEKEKQLNGLKVRIKFLETEKSELEEDNKNQRKKTKEDYNAFKQEHQEVEKDLSSSLNKMTKKCRRFEEALKAMSGTDRDTAAVLERLISEQTNEQISMLKEELSNTQNKSKQQSDRTERLLSESRAWEEKYMQERNELKRMKSWVETFKKEHRELEERFERLKTELKYLNPAESSISASPSQETTAENLLRSASEAHSKKQIAAATELRESLQAVALDIEQLLVEMGFVV